MKKTGSACVLALIIILSSDMARAEDIAGKLGVGANWFYYFESDTDFEGDDTLTEGTAEAFNIHLSYCLPMPTEIINLNLVLDWEYISRDITAEDSGPLSDDVGTATMMPLMLGAQARFASLGKIVPYIGFGLGISFNSISKGEWADDVEEEFENMFPGLDFDANYDVDHSFAFKVPVGMDIFITDNIALNMEAKYFYTQPEFEVEFEASGLSADAKDEVDQSTFAFGVGASFYF